MTSNSEHMMLWLLPLKKSLPNKGYFAD